MKTAKAWTIEPLMRLNGMLKMLVASSAVIPIVYIKPDRRVHLSLLFEKQHQWVPSMSAEYSHRNESSTEGDQLIKCIALIRSSMILLPTHL